MSLFQIRVETRRESDTYSGWIHVASAENGECNTFWFTAVAKPEGRVAFADGNPPCIERLIVERSGKKLFDTNLTSETDVNALSGSLSVLLCWTELMVREGILFIDKRQMFLRAAERTSVSKALSTPTTSQLDINFSVPASDINTERWMHQIVAFF